MFIKLVSLVALAASTAVAQQCTQLLPISLNTGNVNLGARVLAGDSTCSADGTTARVFAAVSLNTVAAVSGSNTLTIPAIPPLTPCTQQTTSVVASLSASVRVCLCIQAGVTLNGNNLPVSVNAAAIADLRPAVAAIASTSAALGALNTILGATPNIALSLTPTAQDVCACPSTSQPTCSGGQCGCIPCPSGQTYNAATGVCELAPSPRARRRSLVDSPAEKAAQLRQAKRSEVVQRMKVKLPVQKE